MSSPAKYILVSLPTSISPANDKEEALSALQSTVASDNITVLPFKIPEFKIGTLDALVQQADDLAKLESSCEAVVAKVGDSLRTLLEGDEDKIAQQKTVNDSKSNNRSCASTSGPTRLESDLPSQSLRTSTFEVSPGTR
jgi:V-type H+-transporting ATPase subunit C